jgi:hypothetical protein
VIFYLKLVKNMPSTSIPQQKAAFAAIRIKKGDAPDRPGTPSSEMAKGMTMKQLKDMTHLKKEEEISEELPTHESIKLSKMAKSIIEEARKKKSLKHEAEKKDSEELPPIGGENEPTKETPPAPENPPAKDTKIAGLGDVNPTEQGDEPTPSKTAPEADSGDEGADVEKAKADATKAKAELEKAKAEKDQAEKEIEQQSHVKLTSKAGVNFLLSKIIGDALKTNSIDAFAAELVDKLRLKNEEDFSLFANEMAPFRIIPGVGELLTTIKGLVGVSSSDK